MVPRILILLQDFSCSSGKLLSRTWNLFTPRLHWGSQAPHVNGVALHSRRGFLYSRKLGKWITYRPSCVPLVVLLAQSQFLLLPPKEGSDTLKAPSKDYFSGPGHAQSFPSGPKPLTQEDPFEDPLGIRWRASPCDGCIGHLA